MRIGLSFSTNRLHYGNENGFISGSIILESGPHTLGLYRWPKVRGARKAEWTLHLLKTWFDQPTNQVKQRKRFLYPREVSQ
jgi:hypothetical protein